MSSLWLCVAQPCDVEHPVSTLIEQRQVDLSTVNPTMMVHVGLTCCQEPEHTALCGARILGVLAHAPADCAVCIEMAKESRPCPVCGTWMQGYE